MDQPAAAQQVVGNDLEAIVVEYLAANHKWKRNEFRIEPKGVVKDKDLVIVWAIYLDDERKPVPGAGKSLILHVDRKERKVVEELGFQ